MQGRDKSNNRNLNSTPDRIRFEFQWAESGLAVLLTPNSFENYPLPYFLQKSLYPQSSQPDRKEVHISEEEISFGFVANLRRKTNWGSLNINFEPCPEMKLRIYLSISELNFPCASDDVLVILLRNEKVMAQQTFLRWTLECPPLFPGDYRIDIKHGKRLLTQIHLTLHDPTDPIHRAAD